MKRFLKNNWLMLLIIAQPVLDAAAYFTANEVATVSGYIRLGIMLLLPLIVLITQKDRRRFLTALAVIAFYCGLHVLNGFRSGYISLYFDLAYLARVVQMPVLALCFVWLIRDEQTKKQGFRGLWIAGALTAAFLLAAWLTHTGNVTYGEGLGFSGWVIDDNRNANSIILVTLATFATGLAVRNGRKLWAIAIPLAVTLIFLTNGTKGCYYALFVIFGAFVLFQLTEAPLFRRRIQKRMTLLLSALMILSIVIYPYTPRAKVSASVEAAAKQGEIEATLLEKGIDVRKMSPEERFEDPRVREVFEYYYYRYMVGVLPDLFDRFGMERVLRWFDMSTDVARLIDTRQIKLAYSGLIWEDSDIQTRIVGFEASQIGFDGTHDLENDWPALFYYYGYAGFALYAAFVLYFIWRMLRRLLTDFRRSVTAENFSLALSLGLLIGLAQFSGAVLRRPNVSVYLALVLALIAYVTREEAPADEA